MAEQDIKEICQSCKYFVTSNAVLGVCKRFPHYVNKHDADWCGEFNARPAIKDVVIFNEVLAENPALEAALPEMAKAAEGLMTISVEPKKRGRKPKDATSA